MCQIRLNGYISINCYHWQKDQEGCFGWNVNKTLWQRIVSELDNWMRAESLMEKLCLTVS